MTTRIGCVSVALIIAAACTARADSPKAATSAGLPVSATPEGRTRALLDRQLKALRGDDAALISTFVKDAVVMLPRVAAKIDPELEIVTQIADLNPHAEVTDTKVKAFVAGGDAAMAWLAAEIEIGVVSHEPQNPVSTERHTVRAIELLDAEAGWQVVAAAFTQVRPLERLKESLGPIPSATTLGPLVKTLALPDALASTLASDPVVVFGTDANERAIGHRAAKALLGKWSKLPLAIEEADKVREVKTTAWAYAMADVNIAKAGGAPYRMSAFLVAIPAAGGTWQVVAVSYGAL
jgi:hypothetical protein